MTRRQYTALSPTEIDALSAALVRVLAELLDASGIAGAEAVDSWSLAHDLRGAIAKHHAAARRRADEQRSTTSDPDDLDPLDGGDGDSGAGGDGDSGGGGDGDSGGGGDGDE